MNEIVRAATAATERIIASRGSKSQHSSIQQRKLCLIFTTRRLSALSWYRQFREIGLMFAISNIEPLCEPL
ncbi:putative transposase [Natrialba aegyptia DSM 13077]|uniref:Putative transposase n=1 Tax=Natrialba aegyptia DSM 13077 TaxID=1227491 RepID=M0AJM7_9EURY|nr:putative transposase [Natrialba aegyptia DSM 13077]